MYLKKDDQKLITLLQQAQLLCSLAVKVNTENTDQSLENAWKIAVKRLKVWSNKAEMEFAVEVEILARARHKNLISLQVYFVEGQERLIVYDYMPDLSLLPHLHGQH